MTHLSRPNPAAAVVLSLCLSILALTAGGCRTAKQKSAELASFDSRIVPLLEGAGKTIGDAPLAAFGECSHFLLTLHEFSNDLFRYLVEEKGFRVFMLESAWAINDYLTEFIKSDRPEIEPWMGFYLNAFDSAPTRKTLLYIRDFNKRHPDDPIQIAGMQPEQPWTDYRELNAVLVRAGLELPRDIATLIERAVFGGKTFTNDIEVIGYHGGLSRQKKRSVSDEDQAAFTPALDRLDAFLAKNAEIMTGATSRAEFEEAKLRVLGLRFYALVVLPMRDFGIVYEKPDAAQIEALTHYAYQTGDAFRFEIIKTQRETRFKGKKIFIWMHTWHAAKESEKYVCTISGQPPKGTTSVGARLFREYGSRYKVIHSVVAVPDFAYPAGVVTIDNAFYRLFGSTPAYVDLHRLTPRDQTLSLDVLLPQFSQIDNEYGGGLVLKDQYDGIAYFPSSELTVKRGK